MKQAFIAEKKEFYLENGVSEKEAEEMSRVVGKNYEIGYHKGKIQCTIALVYNVLSIFGFPVEDHPVHVYMTYDRASQLLQQNNNSLKMEKRGRKEMNWKEIRENIRSQVNGSYLSVFFHESHINTLSDHCMSGLEEGFLNACMESAIASTFLEMEKEGFPVKNHIVNIRMSYEEARAILNNNRKTER